MNNGKYNTSEYKNKQSAKIDRLYGEIEDHNKICVACGSQFVYRGRLKTKLYEKAKYCSRSCANNRQSWWDDNIRHYRTIAFKSHNPKCAVCGFDKIVAIHHIDENRKNNNPSNLIPLCPNHHEMYHSKKWKHEVEPHIISYQKRFICD